MNYIREAENILRNYKDLCDSIINIDKQIDKLQMEGCPKDLKAIVYDGMPSSDPVKDETINVFYKLQCYQDMRKTTADELNDIEVILEKLENDPQGYGKILKLWYVQQLPKEQIAGILGYSIRNVYNLKNKAIRTFAIRLFGINALKAM